MNQMTAKERWLAAINMQPVDQLSFWPKLNGSYPKAQAKKFGSMNLSEIHQWIGSDKHEWIAGGVTKKRKNTSVVTTRDNGIAKTAYTTPYGDLHSQTTYDEASDSWHPTEFPVKDVEDIKRLIAFHEDETIELDKDRLASARARYEEIGDDTLVATGIGESPLMNWIEHIAGVENAHFLLIDHQEEVEALFEMMHQQLVKTTEILCEHSPVDAFYMIENTSTTLISPAQYEKYCSRHISEYAAITKAAGRNMILHMCGHLKALLPQLAKIPVQAFEAYTSPTLGNTTLLDGRSECPDKCLIGGTNAMLWLKSADKIIAQIEHDLSALPHHRGIVVTSAGVMPPMCSPETIKTVCEWVKQYPAIMN